MLRRVRSLHLRGRRERLLRGHLVQARGRARHVLALGRGADVVLLHGLGGLAQEVLEPFRPMARACRLLAIDRPGYGLSDPVDPGDMAPDRQADWLAATLDEIGVERPVVVAHSLGAATALCFAARHPDRVSGLVLITPFCRPTRPAPMPLLRLAVAPVIGRWIRETVVPAIAPLVAPGRLKDAFWPNPVPRTMCRYPVSVAARPDAVMAMAGELDAFNGSMILLRGRLPSLDTPAIVLAGGRDTVAPADRHARWLARQLPRATLREVPEAGHMLHHVAPGKVNAALRDLLGPAAERPRPGTKAVGARHFFGACP